MLLYFVLESFSNFLSYWVTLQILEDYGIAVLQLLDAVYKYVLFVSFYDPEYVM